jgi:hypothetical protein
LIHGYLVISLLVISLYECLVNTLYVPMGCFVLETCTRLASAVRSDGASIGKQRESKGLSGHSLAGLLMCQMAASVGQPIGGPVLR